MTKSKRGGFLSSLASGSFDPIRALLTYSMVISLLGPLAVPPAASAWPPAPTPTPTPSASGGALCGADASKELDLLVNCAQRVTQERRWFFKLVNNGSSPLTISSAGLGIRFWFYEPQLRCVVVTGANGRVRNAQGGDLGPVQFIDNQYVQCSWIPLYQEPPQSGQPIRWANQVGTVSVGYQSGTNVIPPGGWVEGLQVMATAAASCPGQAGDWEGMNDDYSQVWDERTNCSGQSTGPYQDERHFALLRNGTLQQEVKSNGSFDPQSGMPPGAVPCTPTPTRTSTKTPTLHTATSTATSTVSPTKTSTKTRTPTKTPTPTKTRTSTKTHTPTMEISPTLTETPEFSPTPTFTEAPTLTDTEEPTETFTDTDTATMTETETFTETATDTETESPTATDTATPTFTDTETSTETFTGTPTATDTETESPTATDTQTPTSTDTDTPTMTETATPTLTETPANTMTKTNTRTSTATPVGTVCLQFHHAVGSSNFFNQPYDVGLDASGNRYVLESEAQRVQVFTSGGGFLRTWDSSGTPTGIHVDKSTGEVYVVSFGAGQVRVYDPNGALLRSMAGFSQPRNVALDGLGNMYVTEPENHLVRKYTTGSGTTPGVAVTVIGSGPDSADGKLNFPFGVAVGPDGEIYVSENGNQRISVFTPNGDFLRKFGGSGQFSLPRYIRFDDSGRLWVADSGLQRMQVFGPDWGLLASFGSPGAQPGQFNEMRGFSVDPQGYVWIADALNHRVQVFKPCGATSPASLFPDLTVVSVDASGAGTNGQTLGISGTASAVVQNRGDALAGAFFNVAFFEDTVGDGRYHPGVSNLLGTAVQAPLAPGAMTTVSAGLSGTVLFAGNVIYAFVDSTGQIQETDETNNLGHSGNQCGFRPGPASIQPRLKWSWTGSSNQPSSMDVLGTPIVMDVNLDGVPDIVFISYPFTVEIQGNAPGGVLRAVSGADGSEIFTGDPSYRLEGASHLAAGDLEGDGRPEILALEETGRRVFVFDHQGAFLWATDPLLATKHIRSGPSLADLDADGKPEIIVGREAFTHQGRRFWAGTAGDGESGTLAGTNAFSAAADIDLDGRPEVLVGNTAYRWDGTVLWQNNAVFDGFSAAARFRPLDPYPQVVVTGQGSVWLLDRFGGMIWGPVPVPGGGRVGPPTVADLDGDGVPEIAAAGGSSLAVFRADGTLLWSVPIQDLSSGFSGSSAFYFAGDGSANVLFRDESFFRILQGTTGAVLFQVPMTSITGCESPIVADVDGDGKAEVVVHANRSTGAPGANNGVFVYEDAADSWPNSRKVWNQFAYSITNVEENGRIPARPVNNWDLYNTYRANAASRDCLFVAPDLRPSRLRMENNGSDLVFTARIGNGGSASVGPGVAATFYDGDPKQGGKPLGTVATSQPLGIGRFEDLILTFPASAAGTISGPIWVVADDNGAGLGFIGELNEQNNAYGANLYPGGAPPSPDPTQRETFTPTLTATGTPPTATPTPTCAVLLSSGVGDDSGAVIVTQNPGWGAPCGGSQLVSQLPNGTSTNPVPHIYSYNRTFQVQPEWLGNGDFLVLYKADDDAAVAVNGVTFTTCNGNGRGDCFGCRSALVPNSLLVPGTNTITVAFTDTVFGFTGTSYELKFCPGPAATATPAGPTATFTLSPTPVPGAYERRVRVAGPSYIDSQGRKWEADRPFTDPRTNADPAGGWGWTLQGAEYFTDSTVDGTLDSPLYQHSRDNGSPGTEPDLSYRFDVPNGDYRVTVRMSETFFLSPGERVFSVTAEGMTIVSDLDLVEEAGFFVAYDRTFLVTVTDGSLNLDWFASVDQATVSAIEVVGLQALPTPTFTPTRVVGALDLAMNAGGFEQVDTQGVTWVEDQPYEPELGVPYGFYSAGSAWISNNATVDGALPQDKGLYRDWRENPVVEYRFDVPPGSYKVSLKWAEFSYEEAGQRVFDVLSIPPDGLGEAPVTLFSDLDVVAAASFDTAYDAWADGVQVQEDPGTGKSTLVIRLVSKRQFTPAFLAAIRVTGEQPAPTPTATPTQTLTSTATPTSTETGTPCFIGGTPCSPTATPSATATAQPAMAELLRFESIVTGQPVALDGGVVTERLNVIGTATSGLFDHYVLEAKSVSGGDWAAFAQGTTQVTSGVLGVFDPTLSLNGQYQVRLTVVDTDGGTLTTTDPNVFTVEGNMKVGNFTLSFTDLEVPVAGIPMQVIRTYDSRDKGMGDFGVGWRVDVQNIRLEESAPVGTGWRVVDAGISDCIQSMRSHVISITFPDGKVYRFEPEIIGGSNCGSPGYSGGQFRFRALSGTVGTLRSLEHGEFFPGSGIYTFLVNPEGLGETRIVELDGDTTWDADLYELTLEDGRKLRIRQGTGLESMTDLNGNVLTVNSSGIHHSSGKSITFQRTSGRITSITDPVGNVHRYGYSTPGNLTSYRDPTQGSGAGVTYGYGTGVQAHYLTSIKDPRGVTPIRNDYDASGRLTSHTDAFGNVIRYDYDLANNRQAVANRMAVPVTTLYEYDNRGNVTKMTTAAGTFLAATTEYTYDGFDNKLTELLPGNSNPSIFTYGSNPERRLLHTQTDPLGNQTVYTYDAGGRVLTVRDPRLVTTTNTYSLDGKFNLLSTQVTGFPATSYDYNPNGTLRKETDPETCVTDYFYDSFGNPVTQIAASGRPEALMTTFTYDANGNRRTETRHNTGGVNLTTTFNYDGNGRLTTTLFPDGTDTTTIYDSLGKAVGQEDQKNRDTDTVYDAMGRAVTVTYPDTRRTAYGYDAEGRRVSVTEHASTGGFRTTNTDYDLLGRPATVTYADGARTITDYDAQGRAVTVTDGNGNRTVNVYDQAGRRTQVTSGFGTSSAQTSIHTYDANGNVRTVTVGGLLQVTYSYDNLNRQIRADYPGGTFTTTEYDNLGRKTAFVDQGGKRTEWSYDCQGRLTEVSQVTSGGILRTNYTYDAVGNMLTQKDANNHTTTYTYDSMGRRKTRLLPGGQSEFYNTYDATGNLLSKTTFKGESLSYSYHSQTDRLLSESGPGFGHSFEYDGFLRRAVMNDASGATTFNYDERDRLTAKRSPFGRIDYSYDFQGNLTRMITDHVDGASVTYQYDALNRAVTCIDQHRLLNLTTNYQYDPVGNLANVNLPNGIAVTYVYDQLNRLTDMTSKLGSVTVTNYHYTLGNAGNRTHVTEFSGREVNWTYDDLYRLTGQTVSNDPGGITGGVAWTYDNVGNRLTQNSLLPGVLTQDFNADYDLNDRLTEARTYDNNGSTLTDPAGTYTYDALNRLLTVSAGTTQITYKYDGDGNRVQKVLDFGSSAVTTRYLVDTNNLTGYAQVVEELDGGNNVQRVFTYCHDLISQDVLLASSSWGLSYYLYDGQGSVRALTDSTGTVTDTYDYSAFGELLRETHPIGPATSNNYRFQGEQLDPDMGFYYLRARFMNPAIGRFQTMDGFEGAPYDPPALHKYLFANNNPIDRMDPSGNFNFSIGSVLTTVQIIGVLFNSYSTTRAFMEGKTGEALTNLVFLALDFAGVGVIQKAIHRLGMAGSRAMQLSLNSYREWGRRNQMVRWFYKSKFANAKDVIDQMAKSGSGLDDIAREAHRLRQAAQLEARELMDSTELALLEADNLTKWGNKVGPTFEQLLQATRGDLSKIIQTSTKSNPWVDALFMIFY